MSTNTPAPPPNPDDLWEIATYTVERMWKRLPETFVSRELLMMVAGHALARACQEWHEHGIDPTPYHVTSRIRSAIYDCLRRIAND
jgi:hypothetical protein